MIVFTKVALYFEAWWKLITWICLFNRYRNSWSPCTIRQRSIVIHFILKYRVLGLWCIQHIVYFWWSLSYGYRWQNEIKVFCFKNFTILVNQKSPYFLSLNNFLVKVFKTRGKQEISKDNSSFYVNAKRFTFDSFYIREQFLPLLSSSSWIIWIRFILKINLITIFQSIISRKIRWSLRRNQCKIERKWIFHQRDRHMNDLRSSIFQDFFKFTLHCSISIV